MPLTVLSPHSGRPVKVRDQDVGRAVRDEEGRVFYVVPRPQGEGFYASLTRHGSEKDEQRYDKLEAQGAVLEEHRAETAPARPPEPVHDATGRKRPPALRLLVVLVSLTVIAAVAWLGWAVLADRGVLKSYPPGFDALEQFLPERLPDVDPSPSPTEPATPPTVDPVSSAADDASPFADEAGDVADAPLAPDTGDSTAGHTAPQPLVYPEPFRASEPVRDPSAVLSAIPFDPYFDFTPTASGLRYRVERKGFGPKAQVRDYVVVKYRIRHAATGLELDATPEGEPHGFVLWSGAVFRGLDEGVAGMRVGERRTLVVPAELAGLPEGAQRRGVGDDADEADAEPLPEMPAVTLHVDVELLSVLPGVRKTVEEAGAGRFAGPGDTVKLHWALFVGRGDPPITDSRRFGGPVTVTLGAGEVIAGLELGLTGMAEGEVAELHIPPYLAYGAEGAAGGLVPPHASVHCRVELLAVESGP